ncbi:hypothetical protein CGH64_23730, partial [Vibrio parahaemolyticus]
MVVMTKIDALNFLDPEELTHEFTPMGLAEFDSHWLTQFVECSDSILAARIWLIEQFKQGRLIELDS